MAVVYIHKRKTDGIVFYIGIGTRKQRAYSKHGRNLMWNSIVDKHGYDVDVLVDNISIDEAKYYERYLIRYHGRRDSGFGNLCNMTDGGDCVHGYIFTEERRIVAGNINRGKKFTEEVKRKISESHKGMKHKESSKIKMRLARVGVIPWNKGIKTGIEPPNVRAVLLYDKEDNIIAEFKNGYQAAEYANVTQSTVFQKCKKLTKMRDGRYFRYKS